MTLLLVNNRIYHRKQTASVGIVICLGDKLEQMAHNDGNIRWSSDKNSDEKN